MELCKNTGSARGIKYQKNLLRYELRLVKWLGKNFNCREILISELFDFKFCKKLVQLWENRYFSIKKNDIVRFDPNSIDTPGGYFNFLTSVGIQTHREFIKTDIQLLKSEKVFKNKEYYSSVVLILK
jgi:hypothetical protein